ncbi:MAG: hypothetical protein IPO56_10295 [Flavobacteriales bacterium]|nr:hypothetical protein [Flavobacteriales bacterium]
MRPIESTYGQHFKVRLDATQKRCCGSPDSHGFVALEDRLCIRYKYRVLSPCRRTYFVVERCRLGIEWGSAGPDHQREGQGRNGLQGVENQHSVEPMYSPTQLFLIYSGLFFAALVFSLVINSVFMRFARTLGMRDQDQTPVRWSSTAKPSLGGIGFYILFLASFSPVR